MLLADASGAALTVATFVGVGCGGYLLALLLLREAAHDALALAIASGVCAIGMATSIGLLLGALGVLRFELAIGMLVAIVAVLAALVRDTVRSSLRTLWRRARAHVSA